MVGMACAAFHRTPGATLSVRVAMHLLTAAVMRSPLNGELRKLKCTRSVGSQSRCPGATKTRSDPKPPPFAPLPNASRARGGPSAQ